MQEKFIKPAMKILWNTRYYSKLTDKGFPNENVYVKENDVII